MKTAKALFKSKTAVFNFLVGIVGLVAFFIPSALDVVKENAPAILIGIGILNVGLRRVTNQAVALFPLIICGLCLSLMSCAEFTDGVRGPVTGLNYKPNAAGKVRPSVDEVTAKRWFTFGERLLRGEKPKAVFLPPVVTPQK